MIELNQEQLMKTLDTTYNSVLNGIGKNKSVYDLVDEYRNKYNDPEIAIRKLINNQTTKTTVTGIMTGLGGVVVLPVALPADIFGCMYVQIRMVASIALLRGYDLNDDHVQTFVYACLLGQSVNELLKEFGIKLGVKVAENVLKKVPGKIFIEINKKVGFRLVTKYGSKGLINLGKMIPLLGAPISGAFNLAETKTIATAAKTVFAPLEEQPCIVI